MAKLRLVAAILVLAAELVRADPEMPDLNTGPCGDVPLLPNAKRFLKLEDPKTGFENSELERNRIIKVTYECNEGFNMEGSPDLLCNKEFLMWDDLPTCVANNTCGLAPKIDDAIAEWQTFANGSGYGDQVHYKCIEQYQIGGDATITCQLDGTWTKLPNCGTPRVFGCGHPPNFYLSVVLDKSYPDARKAIKGDYVAYGCQPGYLVVDGPSVLVCNGTHWSEPVPRCEPWPDAGCGPPPWVENANITERSFENSSSITNDYIVYECLPGYTAYDDDMTITCGGNGRWPRLPECREIKACDYPPLLQHGRVYKKTYKVYPVPFSKVTYTCYDHFTMKGFENATCLTNYTWSRLPKCVESEDYFCPPIDPVQNALIEEVTTPAGEKPKPGDLVKYRCDANYRRIGPRSSRCLVSLRWSAQPLCLPLRPEPELRRLDGDEEPPTTTTTEAPDKTFCKPPANYSNAVLVAQSFKATTAATPGDIVVYQCDKGFVNAPDTSTSQLCATGEWLGIISCIPAPYSCPSPPSVEHARIKRRGFSGNRGSNGDSVTYTCETYYAPANPYGVYTLSPGEVGISSECRLGVWINLPVCRYGYQSSQRRASCRSPAAPPAYATLIGASSERGPYQAGDYLIYQCNENFTLRSSLVETSFPMPNDHRIAVPIKAMSCADQGYWSEAPVCVPVPRPVAGCGPVASMAENVIVITAEGVVGSPPNPNLPSRVNDYLMVDCMPGFELNGTDKIICQPNGNWTKSPNCIAITCGLMPTLPRFTSVQFKSYENLSNIDDFVLVRCRAGYRLTTEVDKIVCTASGNWSAPLPNCRRIIPERSEPLPIVRCSSAPPVPRESSIIYSSFGGADNSDAEAKVGDYAVFGCPDGYNVMRNSTVTCQLNGVWTRPSPCTVTGSNTGQYWGGLKRGPQCLKGLNDKRHTSCLGDSYGLVSLRPVNVRRILDDHNLHRRNVTPAAANMKDLEWDNELAITAERWAAQCTTSNDDGLRRSIMQKGWRWVGQNIYASVNQFPVSQAVQSWAEEKKYWKYGIGSTDPGEMVGHYTQIVWAQTLYIGCAMSSCSSTTSPLANIMVCNYAPGGNTAYIGQNPYARPYLVASPTISRETARP